MNLRCPLRARPVVPNCAGRSRSLSIDFSRLRDAMRSANLQGPELQACASQEASWSAQEGQSSCTGSFEVSARPQAPRLACAAWAVKAPLHQIPLARNARCERAGGTLPEAPQPVPYRPKPYRPEPKPYSPKPYCPEPCGLASSPKPYLPTPLSKPGTPTRSPEPAALQRDPDWQPDWPPDGPWVRFLVWWETWLAPRLPFLS